MWWASLRSMWQRSLTLKSSLIASLDVFEDLLFAHGIYLGIVPVAASPPNGSAVSRMCGQENLTSAFGEYHGANVTTFRDYIAILASATLRSVTIASRTSGMAATALTFLSPQGVRISAGAVSRLRRRFDRLRVTKKRRMLMLRNYLNDFLGISHINALTRRHYGYGAIHCARIQENKIRSIRESARATVDFPGLLNISKQQSTLSHLVTLKCHENRKNLAPVGTTNDLFWIKVKPKLEIRTACTSRKIEETFARCTFSELLGCQKSLHIERK